MNRKSIILLLLAALFIAVSCQKEDMEAARTLKLKTNEPVQLWAGGPFWASVNIGAGKPQDYGRFYAWGYSDSGSRYEPSGALFYGTNWLGGWGDETRVTFSPEYLYYYPPRSFSDYTTHTYENMASSLGGTWRLPTEAEFQDLLDNCTAEFVSDGTPGVKFTGRGDFSGKSIFLPTAGYGEAGEWKDKDISCAYWTSTQLSMENAWCLNITFNKRVNVGSTTKYLGLPVRPVYDPKVIPSDMLLNGQFTVNKYYKTVRFSKGNLYYSGKDFQFEKNQYDYPTVWDIVHVGHFYSTSNASYAFASTFDGSASGGGFVLFTNSTRIKPNDMFTVNDVKGFRNLDEDEWNYILYHRDNASELRKNDVTVCGQKNCLVLAPDNFSGNIQASYDAAAWSKAETEGLVCLPPAGFRAGTYILNPGVMGLYKSSGATKDWATSIRSLYFRSDLLSFGIEDYCDNGGALRLVMDN